MYINTGMKSAGGCSAVVGYEVNPVPFPGEVVGYLLRMDARSVSKEA